MKFFLQPVTLVLIFCIWLTSVQSSYEKGLGAAAMFLPPGCKELYDEIQKKVKASSPKLQAWIKSECEKQCNGRAPFAEAEKYEDWGFTFVEKLNGWLKSQKPAMDIFSLCPKAFNKEKMLMISGEVKRVCFESTPFGKKMRSNQDVCHIKDQPEFKEFSDCVEKFIKDKVIPKVMANPPMDCIPRLKPYCSNRKAVLGWLAFWMDTTFAKKSGNLGDPNLQDIWNPYKVVNNFYANKCKAVTSDTKHAPQTQFPPWSDK